MYKLTDNSSSFLQNNSSAYLSIVQRSVYYIFNYLFLKADRSIGILVCRYYNYTRIIDTCIFLYFKIFFLVQF